MNSSPKEISSEDIEEVIAIIRHNHGYDFSDYARSSLRRRIQRCMDKAGMPSAEELQQALKHDKSFFNWFLETVTVNVTEMFRDPGFFRDLRTKVIPALASYPTIKIWHAGCATGEEMYSVAILLEEAGLLGRSRLYGTDLNPANLERARQGIVPLSQMRDYTYNYLQSGGTNDFSAYYTARYDYAIFNKELRKNMIFSQHNLVTDQVFNEFQLICCRNVLIYFNRELQNRVFRLFYNSLTPLGYLGIGLKESLLFTDVQAQFETVSATTKLFRRRM